MNNRERFFIAVILLAISLLTFFDVIEDLREGASFWHVGFESLIIFVAACGVIYLLLGVFKLKKSLENEKILSEKLIEENKIYKQQAKSYIDGLSLTIDKQLNDWKLSKSEKEVAFLLLKGFSSKEVAEVRGTTEKTARTQAASIYSKADISTRGQLSAFFLEDLLAPHENQQATEKL